jgi:hypothetical protein
MTSRPHDALFKLAFEAPADVAPLLRELLPPAVRDAIAWETLDHEPGSFIDPVLADHHGDLLFSARPRTGAPTPLYFLLEHQSTDDPVMPLRGLSYQLRIWDRFRKEHPGAPLPTIVTLLVSHVPGGWTAARSLEELFEPVLITIPGMAALVPRFSILALDLAGQSNDALAARSLGAFQKLALWLLRDSRDPARLLGNFDVWAPVILEAGQSRGRDALAALFSYMFRVVDRVNHDELRAKIRELGARPQGVAVTIAEYLHEEGRKVGLEQGLQQGRAATLRSLLVLKFQALSDEHEARLTAAAPEAIDRYLQRLLTADSLAAVFAD